MPDDQWPLAGKRIGILGKGGCGKSTITVLLAKILTRQGHRVCILDADSTNVGLAKALGLDDSPEPLIDHFGGMVFEGGAVTCPVDDPSPLKGANISLESLPAEFRARSPEGITLLALGKMGDRGPGGGCDGPMAKIARDLRVEAGDEPLVTLVDFKAGFEDSARGVITGLDVAVVVVDPTGAAVEMAADMRRMVERILAGGLPATGHLENPEMVELANQTYRQARIGSVSFVLNKVTSQEVENCLRDKLSERGIQPTGVVHEDPRIPMAWLRGEAIEAGRAEREVLKIIEGLETSASETGTRAISMKG